MKINSSKDKLIQRLVPWKKSSEIYKSFKGLSKGGENKNIQVWNEKGEAAADTEKAKSIRRESYTQFYYSFERLDEMDELIMKYKLPILTKEKIE